MELFIPPHIIDVYTRSKVLGIKLSGHTNTLTEASKLMDELYKRGQYKPNNNVKTLLINFVLNKWSFQVKI